MNDPTTLRVGTLHANVTRGPGNPVLMQGPHEAAKAQMGTRPRPHYAPRPVGPSRNDILTAKSQLVHHRRAVKDIKTQLANMEVLLGKYDPQMVCACVVPGYTDPPERVERAERERAMGRKTVFTQEDAFKVARGEMAPPTEHPGVFSHQIFDLKQRIVHYRLIAEHTDGHDAYLEYDLDQLDPQHVCAAHVADYKDPPERVAKADAAKAAGQVPDEATGV